MEPDHKVLTSSEWDRAHHIISLWKNDPGSLASCPRCDAKGLSIEDRSARPYAEWYAMSCANCGLAVTMHLPLAPTPGPPV